MRRLIFAVGLVLLVLTACGVSQSEFDAVVEEVNVLSAIVSERDAHILQLELELADSASEVAMLTARVAELSEEIVVLDFVIADLLVSNSDLQASIATTQTPSTQTTTTTTTTTTQGEALQEAWEGAADAAREAGRAIRDSFWEAWNRPVNRQ